MVRALILANSKKHSERCVAAFDLDADKWLRPVGPRRDGELWDSECRVHAGGKSRPARVGDIVEMALGANRATAFHPEDIETRGDWQLVDRRSPQQIRETLHSEIRTTGAPLGDYRDRIALVAIEANKNHHSLELFDVERPQFFTTTNFAGNPQLRGRLFDDQRLDLSVTDDAFAHDEQDIQRCLATVSLTVPFVPKGSDESSCFKVIAGVMPY